MAELRLPLSVTYETEGVTPIADIVAALQGADVAIQDAISLIPSLFKGIHIERSEINVRSLSQESPLRELFLVSLIVAFQGELKSEIPPMIEDIFKVDIPQSYDSLVTVVTMIVLFYGAAFLKDAATKAVEDTALRRKLNSIIQQLSIKTGLSPDEITKILDAKYSKPGPVKRLVKSVNGFFRPARREGSVTVVVDRERIEPQIIRDLPYSGGDEVDDTHDFERFESHNDVLLEIHAQDKDKINVGWAAVPRGLTDHRIRMKLVEPVTSQDVWNKDTVTGDITIVSKLTPEGYVPSEIHLTRISKSD